MSLVVFADGTANLPRRFLEGISLLPLEYTVDGQSKTYYGDVDSFDGHSFYENLRNGSVVRTTLINIHSFMSHFAPVQKQGLDVIYISMSSAISGTCSAARTAAAELMEQYKQRIVHVVDSLGCGFGNGMLALQAGS